MIKKSLKKSKKNKQRSAKGRSLLFVRSTKSTKKIKKNKTRSAPKNWRSKQYKLPVGLRRSLIITRRKYRTKKANRTLAYRQFVLQVNNAPFPVREIAFRILKRPKKTKPATGRVHRLRLKFVLPIVLIIIGLGGTVFFGVQVWQDNKNKNLKPTTTFSLPTPTTATVETKPKVLEKSEPKHLRITRLGIDYATIPIGQKADGTMEVPPVLQKVTGWYKYSPTPGELGPSVIVGHVDSYKGPSVFWRLREMVAGDIVEVTRADGKIVKFKVDSLQQFDQANFPTEQVYGNIDTAGLRLITCGGTFNRATGRYTENTVVFASLLVE